MPLSRQSRIASRALGGWCLLSGSGVGGSVGLNHKDKAFDRTEASHGDRDAVEARCPKK
jgi:hypothetical protein